MPYRFTGFFSTNALHLNDEVAVNSEWFMLWEKSARSFDVWPWKLRFSDRVLAIVCWVLMGTVEVVANVAFDGVGLKYSEKLLWNFVLRNVSEMYLALLYWLLFEFGLIEMYCSREFCKSNYIYDKVQENFVEMFLMLKVC